MWILLVLVLAGAAEAGEPDCTFKLPKPYESTILNFKLVWEQTPTDCGSDGMCASVKIKPKVERLDSCYQRMQEAMKLASRYLNVWDDVADVRFLSPWKGMSLKDYKTWEQVMKECVQ